MTGSSTALPRIAIIGFAHSPNVVGTHGTTNLSLIHISEPTRPY